MEKPRESTVNRSGQAGVSYRRILVPLDGTTFAEAAVRPAAALAARAGAALHLVSVLRKESEGTRAVSMEPMTPEGVGPGPHRTRDREAIMRDIAERVRAEHALSADWELLAGDSPSKTLVNHAAKLRPDLIVAATRSRGWVARGLLGSTSWDLVEAETSPVLLIPSDDDMSSLDEAPMQGAVETVAVALAPGSEESREALEHALAWASIWGAKLVIAQVVVTIPVPSAGPEGTGPVGLSPNLSFDPMSHEDAEEQLGGVLATLRTRGVDVSAELLEGPDPADALLGFVESSGADLLVVGKHHRKLWERVFGGSDSGRLARRIRSAGLLVCHEPAG